MDLPGRKVRPVAAFAARGPARGLQLIGQALPRPSGCGGNVIMKILHSVRGRRDRISTLNVLVQDSVRKVQCGFGAEM